MPTWKDLYELLIDKSLSPDEVVARLGVRPSWLRRLLASKHLVARLAERADRRSQVLGAVEPRPPRGRLRGSGRSGRGNPDVPACLRPAPGGARLADRAAPPAPREARGSASWNAPATGQEGEGRKDAQFGEEMES